jgi:hypothetical protein
MKERLKLHYLTTGPNMGKRPCKPFIILECWLLMNNSLSMFGKLLFALPFIAIIMKRRIVNIIFIVVRQLKKKTAGPACMITHLAPLWRDTFNS